MQKDAEQSVAIIKESSYMKASLAITIAGDLLESAKAKTEENSAECFQLARNSIRIAASALLFNDGKISDNFQTICNYITEKYPDKFPVNEWKEIEEEEPLTKPGPITKFFQQIGLLKERKPANNEQAEKAITIAEEFINLTREIIMG